MPKLIISDPDTGERLGALVIPEGATQEQIIAAGKTAQARLLAARKLVTTVAEQQEQPLGAERQIMCQLCRRPQPESQFTNHVNEEEQEMLRREQAALAARG